MTHASSKSHDTQQLDALTGGAFSAATSGERAARIRDWLAGNPTAELMQEVYKELSVKDKGAAKPLREKLDELRRAKGQEILAAEWATRGQALLDAPRLNIADALAWQRDAAKVGAPLSREPLASIKSALTDRVKVVEDLQNQVMVQREAAVLLAQRIELLSTKSWKDAQSAAEGLRADVAHWQTQAGGLQADANWPGVDSKFPTMIETSRSQLVAVWDAFAAALVQTELAAADAEAPLPPVPVWADELRVARGLPPEAVAKAAVAAAPAKPKVDPAVREEQRQKATAVITEALLKVEQEVGEGHGKASASAANALRNAFKDHGRFIDATLEARVHGALTHAGELEGWQRWRADQLREELIAKAEALLQRKPKAKGKPARAAAPAEEAAPATTDAPVPAAESEVAAPADAAPVEAPAPVAAPAPETAAAEAPVAEAAAAEAPAAAPAPTLGGRKMQEALRKLREEWKAIDQGNTPNHALWKRFDEACNEAHKVVEVWLNQLKAETAAHRAQRLSLIEEVKAFAAANAERAEHDWKALSRTLHQFADRWRDAGHLSEKAFAELQPLWKEANRLAAAPLETAQKESLARRHAMIEEATALGAAPVLRIDAVKALQHRWQAEAQTVPLERKAEQKLWDAFRKPIDEAFNRKTQEREKAASAMSERDRAVLDAAKALEAANASGDAQQIRAAMTALDAALRGQAQAAAAVAAAAEPSAEAPADAGDAAEAAAPAAAPKPAAKPVVAMRGDDRPGMKKAEPAAPVRGGKFGDRKDGPRGAGRDGKFEPRRDDRGGRFGDRPAPEDRGPRLGDTAFRAQREALEHAEAALRKLAAQAHGEALTQLLTAWEKRDAGHVPSTQELGRAVTPAVRSAWTQALNQAPQGEPQEALLRLEMAAEVPTPAEHLDARRALQLKLLTRRNDPAPTQTWSQDAARVLGSGYDAAQARRLQNVLKVLLKR